MQKKVGTKGLNKWQLLKENPSTNLEKIYTYPYRSFNFQQLFFYDIFLRNAYFTSYRSSKYSLY